MVAVQDTVTAARDTKNERNIGQVERIASVAAGGGLALAGLRMLLGRRPVLGLSLAAAGSYLVRRGVAGHSALYESLGVHAEDADNMSHPFARELRTEDTMTVSRTPEEAYRLWRDRDVLLQMMPMLERVEARDDRHLHLVGRDPATGARMEWDSEVIEDRPGELFAWRSSGQTTFTSGQVKFCEATGGRGTVVRLEMRYRPPGGVFGALIAKLRGQGANAKAREVLRRFKEIAEAGEVATNTGPAGAGRERAEPIAVERQQASCGCAREKARDRVEEASQESFPASDAPAWNSDPAVE